MAVRSFLHYALEVPDQTVGQKYYQDFGLVDASSADDRARLAARLGLRAPRQEDAFYVWGPAVPSDFGVNTEAAA